MEVVEKRLSNNHMIKHNISHWDKIVKYRENNGLKSFDTEILNHELVNKPIVDNETRHEYIIESVHKQYYAGYYISLKLKNNNTNSHVVIFWHNINSVADMVIQQTNENYKRWRVL